MVVFRGCSCSGDIRNAVDISNILSLFIGMKGHVDQKMISVSIERCGKWPC